MFIIATNDDDDAALSLQEYVHLDDLHLEVDLDSRSFPWALQVLQTWSKSEKSSCELIIYDEKALESTGERRCNLDIQDAETGKWADCDSWQVWWEFATDMLMAAFSPCSDNHGKHFHGDFLVTFITSEKLQGSPHPSSHFTYAHRLLGAYQRRVR